jgi:MATE family multidrug resistance protein
MTDLIDKKQSPIMHALRLSAPIILGQMGTVVMGITDTYFVGKLGEYQLASASICNSVFFTTIILGLGVMYAVSTLSAAAKSAEGEGKTGSIFKATLCLSILMGLIFNIIILILANNFGWLKQAEGVNIISKDFLNILGISAIPLLIYLGAKHFCDGLEITTPGLIITLGGMILNAVLNQLFIYGWGPIPAMGFNGSAWATLTTRVLMASTFLIYIYRSTSLRIYIKQKVQSFTHELIAILKIGIPSGLQYFFEIAAFSGANMMMGWISPTTSAAHSIALQPAVLTYMAASGVSVAGSILVGNGVGRNSRSEIIQAGKSVLQIVGIWMGFTCLCFMIFNTQLASLFVHPDNIPLMQQASTLLLIAGVFQLSDGFQCVALGILRGIGDTSIPTAITLIAYWGIGLPVGYILGFTFHWGGIGIWAALLMGLTFSAIALNWRFFKLSRRFEISN